MKKIRAGILVFLCCVLMAVGHAQPSKPGLCSLGDIQNDSLLPYIDSLRLTCSQQEVLMFRQKSKKLSSLSFVIVEGDADANVWAELFGQIEEQPTVKSFVFKGNSFTSLPKGFEKLYRIEQLKISNNEEIDYFQTFRQLQSLSNLKELSLDMYTIYDLPDSLFYLKNLSKITLINNDEFVSETDTTVRSGNETAIYDYYLQNGNATLSIKYISIAGVIDSDEYLELSRRFKTTNNYTIQGISSSQVYAPVYKNVIPPIAGIDVVRNRYSINPEIENVLVYPSGTKILVPANAFVDQDGKAVKDDVVLSYREFRDPVDILVSGIPMKYDSAGSVADFESAGMFEINASSGQKPLTLAAGKQIKMNFASTSADSTYNFYSYNDNTGNWDYNGRPKPVTASTEISIKMLSDAYKFYKSYLQNQRRYTDSSSFNERFESADYAYVFQVDSNYINKEFRYKENGKSNHKNINRLIRITRVRRTREGDILFKIRYNSHAHHELSEFDNAYFLVNGTISPEDFKKKYFYRRFYNDVRIYKNGGGVEVKLKDRNGFDIINAELVSLNEKGKVVKLKGASGKLSAYNKALKKRERYFTSKRKNPYYYQNEITIAAPKAQALYAYDESKKYMSKEERRLSYEKWMNYYNQVIANEKLALSNAKVTTDNIINSLALDSMGIYNCDQILRLQDPVEIFAKYTNKDLNKLSPKSIYIIDKKINSVMQYNGYMGYGPDKIAFSNAAGAKNVLLAINKDGSMAIYKPEDFKQNAFTNKQKFTFRVEELGNKYSTVGEFKKCMGL